MVSILSLAMRYSGAVYRRLPDPVSSAVVPFLRPVKNYLMDTLYLRQARSAYGDARWPQMEQVFSSVSANEVKGDYLEFGVYYGQSFLMAFKLAEKYGLRDMRFFAFDSFHGFPSAEGQLSKGLMAASRGLFSRYIRRGGVDMGRVGTIEGVYNESLTAEVKRQHQIRKAAVVHLDCDLYLSTRDVLGFITDLLHPGTILIFDDWDTFDNVVGRDNAESFGQQRAFGEWGLRDRFQEIYHVGLTKAFTMVPARVAPILTVKDREPAITYISAWFNVDAAELTEDNLLAVHCGLCGFNRSVSTNTEARALAKEHADSADHGDHGIQRSTIAAS